MIASRGDYSSMSQSVIGLLVRRGMTLTQIAKLLGVSKSYVSRVNSGTRSFTLEHLVTLQHRVGEPLPLLLIEAIPRKTVSAHLRPLYDATLQLLREVGAAEPLKSSPRKISRGKQRGARKAKAA